MPINLKIYVDPFLSTKHITFYNCSKMSNDVKYDVKLHISQKIYNVQMGSDVLQSIKREMDDYTITLKHYDTPVEILSEAPAFENMELDEEVK